MILNKGECVICDSADEFQGVWDVLKEHGYRWWSKESLDVPPSLISRGVRWSLGDEFPYCIATMSARHIESALRDSVIEDRVGRAPYVVLSAAELFSRSEKTFVAVDDLL